LSAFETLSRLSATDFPTQIYKYSVHLLHSNVTTTIVVSGVILYVIMAWITIHFGRKPRNGGSPPRDSSDVNIMNFISVTSLFVIMVWLINDASDSLIADYS